MPVDKCYRIGILTPPRILKMECRAFCVPRIRVRPSTRNCMPSNSKRGGLA